MRLPSFDQARNTPCYDWRDEGEYQIDFSTHEHRKYREDRGVRVYEGGLVEIQPSVWRDPSLRHYLGSTYGLHFYNPYESSARGFRYFLPDKRTPVPKAWIPRLYYLHDPRYGMVVKVPAVFYGGHSRLVGTNFDVFELDRKKVTEFKEEHKDLFAFATTYTAMSARLQYLQVYPWTIRHNMKYFRGELLMPSLDDIRKNVLAYEKLLLVLADLQRHKSLDYYIRKYCRLRHQVPFLYYEEGK